MIVKICLLWIDLLDDKLQFSDERLLI